MERQNCQIELVLFGSRAEGRARPDSDFDVLLVSEELCKHLMPGPLPHDQPGFYGPPTTAKYHHQRKRDWSTDLWRRLGGEVAVLQFRERAAIYVSSLGFGPSDGEIDVFLYVPPTISRIVWAVELVWNYTHARFDFACEASQALWSRFPELENAHQQIFGEKATLEERATALERAIVEIAGVAIGNEFREYPSLNEVRRDVARHQGNQSGLP